jgi:hypothetical protein
MTLRALSSRTKTSSPQTSMIVATHSKFRSGGGVIVFNLISQTADNALIPKVHLVRSNDVCGPSSHAGFDLWIVLCKFHKL